MDETEFNGIEYDSASSRSEFDILSCDVPITNERDSWFKTKKTEFLTYLRHNYLFVLKILLFVIVSLVLLFAALFILYFIKVGSVAPFRNNNNNEYSKITTTDFPSVSAILMPEFVSSKKDHPEPCVQPKPDDSSEIELLLSKNRELCLSTDCISVKPKDLLCYLDELNYSSIMIYSCCECLPPGYVFKRYIKDRRHKTTSLAFSVLTIDPLKLSEFDLQLMASLKNLRGSWNVIEESDTSSCLVFAISGYDRPPDDN